MPQSLRQHLLRTLQGLPSVPTYWIAYSGGLDSTVLLHLLASMRDELELKPVALHIDHGLAEHSRQWSEQCRAFSESLGVPIRIERVSINGQQEKGLEAAARHARYAVFEKALGEGEALVTAHHRDDQAETLLLQLLRGGGVHGLAAMPMLRPLGEGLLARPLLDVPRERLKAYAVEQGLTWIDDPSNFDTSLDRNYLRHTLLPQLAERRGGIREVLARSAGHFAESARLLDELAEMDRQQAMVGDGILSVAALKALSPERCRNLLRFHLRRLGLPLPEHKHLQRILEELLPAAEDAMPLVAWPGAEVRRYRDGLYCMAPLPPLPGSMPSLSWRGEPEMALPQRLGRLELERVSGQGVSAKKLEQGHCEVRLRQGGERIRPAGRQERHALKKLYQEAGVPPWLRARLPLVYLDGELVQVPGYWVAADVAADGMDEGIIFHWRREAIEKEVQNDDN
ncbi:MAG: tRNA lysidine(34) synthetase TilS [Pseudomonadota bacterium]